MSEWTWEHICKQEHTTEGPAWDGILLLFSHLYANQTLSYDPKSREIEVWRDDTNEANGMVFDRAGRLFACEGAARRVVQCDRNGVVEVVADGFGGRPFNRPNDVAIDDAGNVWFSDPNYGEHPGGQDGEFVYRASRRGGPWDVTRVTSDTVRPNGVLFSLDESTLFVSEIPRAPVGRRELRAYPVLGDSTLGNYEALHDFGDARSIDGMCLAADGNIVACAGYHDSGPGPMIYVFAPNGRILSTHPAPANRPTNCTFAEAGLGALYVTFETGDVYRVPDTGMKGHLAFPPGDQE